MRSKADSAHRIAATAHVAVQQARGASKLRGAKRDALHSRTRHEKGAGRVKTAILFSFHHIITEKARGLKDRRLLLSVKTAKQTLISLVRGQKLQQPLRLKLP